MRFALSGKSGGGAFTPMRFTLSGKSGGGAFTPMRFTLLRQSGRRRIHSMRFTLTNEAVGGAFAAPKAPGVAFGPCSISDPCVSESPFWLARGGVLVGHLRFPTLAAGSSVSPLSCLEFR